MINVGTGGKNNKIRNMTRIKKTGGVDVRVKDIRVYYTNSRSIRNKINLLRGLTSVEHLDVIAIMEI